MTAVTIDTRFIGPPRSANGGYTCGIVAEALGDGPADVRLLAPPPVGVALDLEVADGTARLAGPDGPIAVGRPWDGDIEPPPPVSRAEAEGLTGDFDLEGYRRAHAFPGCFTCGPDRSADDGLRIFPAPHPERELVAWPWSPSDTVTGADGLVIVPVIWAALDCPSGLIWSVAGPEPEPAVLGRLATRITRRPAAGEPCVAAGWRLEADGRRRHSGSALWSAEGEVLARAESTWVALTEEQMAAFGAR